MQSVTVGTVTMLECAACDGLWVDAASFERICAEREAQAALLHSGNAAAPALEKRVTYRPCLRCGTMMNRINFAQLSGTIVDVCKGHGTFLDRGELQAIVTFIHAGGLERARQRRIEDLKEQERRLRDQEWRRLSRPFANSNDAPYREVTTRLAFDTIMSLLLDP